MQETQSLMRERMAQSSRWVFAGFGASKNGVNIGGQRRALTHEADSAISHSSARITPTSVVQFCGTVPVRFYAAIDMRLQKYQGYKGNDQFCPIDLA